MGMRKESYDSDGMMLKQSLDLYNKESLLEYASALGIRKASGLSKSELAEKIAEELLTPSVVRRRMAVFTSEQRKLLEHAMKEPFIPTEEELEDTLRICESDYAFFDKQQKLNVPVDVKVVYGELNTSEFCDYAKKMSWLFQCLNFGENFYGIFDMKILIKVYNARKDYELPSEEIEKLCEEFPQDMSECLIDSERKHIIAEYLTYDDKDKELLDMQEGKEFYIPDYREVLDYAKNLYLSEEPAYEKLKNFFHLEMNMSNREASEETEEIWERFSFGIGFERNIQATLEEYEDMLDDSKLETLLALLQNANAHTRMQIHRGHTWDEIEHEAVL